MTTLTIVHCAEDALAQGVSEHLLDRLLAEEAPPWFRDLLDPNTRSAALRYIGLDGQDGWLNWSKSSVVETRAAHRRLRLHPRCGGNAARAYVSFRLASLLDPGGELLLLLAFDTDQKPDAERCAAGVAEARQHIDTGLRVLVAEASPEFDAWVLGGFQPKNTRETEQLADAKDALARSGHPIDPIGEHHRLTSNTNGDARDAKELCKRLLGLSSQAHPSDSRVIDCLETSLTTLETRGAQSGLADFLAEARRVIQTLLPR